MSWNYRIIRKDGVLQIMETYYDENGVPDSFGEAPTPYGENVDEVEACYKLIGEAFNKNIIEVDSNWKVLRERIIHKDYKECENKKLFKIAIKDIYRKSILIMSFSVALILLDVFLPLHIKEQFITADIFEFLAFCLLISVGIGYGLRYYEIVKGDR